MAKKARKADENQLDFHMALSGFETRQPTQQADDIEDGSLEFDQRLKRALNNVIKQSSYSRTQLAEMLAAVTGRDITKTTIDSWTGAARPNQFPAHLIPAFCVVTGSTELLELLVEPCGVQLTATLDAQHAKLGRMWLLIRHAQSEQEKLISELPIFNGRIGG